MCIQTENIRCDINYEEIYLSIFTWWKIIANLVNTILLYYTDFVFKLTVGKVE